MSTSKFAETHNLVAFLEKPEESNGFDGIIDFLNASSIKYVLTVNPTIYKSCIQQFWATAKAKTVNGERQIQTLVDKKKVIITEKSVRSDLMLEDAEGTECLPNDVIFKQLILMGKQRKDSGPIEPIPDVTTNEEPTSTPSCDPPQSGKDRLQLAKLMTLCTKLQKRVLDLEKAKTAQAKEIANLKKREDASKQGRKIADLDADAEVTLIDETLERFDEEMLFDVQDDLQVTTAGEVVTTTSATTIVDELTLAATTDATRITTVVASTRPKAKGIVFHDKKEQASAFTPIVSSSQLLQAKEQAELEKERVEHQEASREAIIEELDNIQVMIDANEQLAAKLQAEEQEQFLIQEKSRMLVEMIAKRKKFFAAQRAAKQRSKPPTKNQLRNRMCTYLNNMGGYKHTQLKRRSYEEIHKLFDKAYKQLESDKSKKQKIDKHVEAEKDDQEEAKMKRHIEIVKDDDVAIDAIPLATKPPVIVEYKIDKDGRIEDLETLWKLVKAKHENTRPEEDYERVLWGDLKVMFEPDIKCEGRIVGFKRLHDILRVTAAQLQLLSGYYCWKKYVDRDEIKD
ncbi:hypothetical protein Tco_0975579 [Tanacetum coccineum]|uniref:Xylulose kinase-1 n=1 Tax=Tanacetum coccineum TaxID=301880 RepID=A0ABQ5EG02_9ASTR